jgi:predicted enzyme related to lactoylglutathione lyase
MPCVPPMRPHTASSSVRPTRFSGARTASLPGGGSIGVRGPLRDTEEPVVRPYWLVDDIEAALDAATKQGAFVAHPPLEIPGKGTFAIYIQGDVDHGLWQL